MEQTKIVMVAILLFVRECIPSTLLSTENGPLEGFCIELNMCKKKRLICGSYNPHRNFIDSHLDSLIRSLALHSSTYENYIVIGDFNVEIDNIAMSDFCNTFDLTSLIKRASMLQ